MAAVSIQKYTSPYERTANPQYESRTGLPKLQVMIGLGNQANTTQRFEYGLTDTINMAMRMEIVSVYAKTLVKTSDRPYLVMRFNSLAGRIVGEKMKETYESRFNGTNEFAKTGVVIPYSPDANGLCSFHQNPIVVTDFKDPKDIRAITVEVRDVFDNSISFADLVIELNVYCMIDN